MRKIAIIPARGGSKRIPRKNIKPFFGKPIIAYSLQSAMESEIFDHIHVSTEDKEIYEVVSNLGFNPRFYRSADCAQDHTPVKEVLIESLKEFEKQGECFEVFCLLSATAPLISSIDLIEAYKVFEKENFLFPLLAVARYPVPIQRAMKINKENNTLEPIDTEAFLGSSHGLEERYHDIGSFAFFTKDQLLIKFDEIKFIPYVLPLKKSVDIDNLEDWDLLEKIYCALNNSSEL
ncbi:MAG: cytidylyltransferase domain-containing protein [Candidatus Paracaedibacter sp.]